MKMKQGNFANGYNIQTMTENGFVLSSYLANSSADQHLLTPTIQVFQKIKKTTALKVFCMLFMMI